MAPSSDIPLPSRVPGRPFRATPDPNTFYPSSRHEKALAAILRGLSERCGLILLAGEIGTGKTTLCNYIRTRHAGEFRIGYSGNPFFTKHELLRHMCGELGAQDDAAATESSTKDHLDALTAFLRERQRLDETVVFILDEAHLLNPPLYEILLILSNLQTGGVPLLQIMLVGQIELLDVLRQQRLASLNQRIAVRQRLTALNRAETFEYIEFRMRQAGGENEAGFSQPALTQIWRTTRGTPRLINQLCGRVLENASLSGKHVVDRKDVMEVVSDPVYAQLFHQTAKSARLTAWPSLSALADRLPVMEPGTKRVATLAAACFLLALVSGMLLWHAPSVIQGGPEGQIAMPTAGADNPTERFLSAKPLVLAAPEPPEPPAPPTNVQQAVASAAPGQAMQDAERGKPRPASPALKIALKPAVKAVTSGGEGDGQFDALGLAAPKTPIQSKAIEEPRPAAVSRQETATAKAQSPAPATAAPQLQAVPRPAQIPETPKETVLPGEVLPEVRLNALAWDDNVARRMVILNDKILHEGDVLGKIKIVRIERDGVALERDGLQFFKSIKKTGEQ